MKQMKKYLFRLVAFLGLTITPFIASAEEVSLGESISKFLNDTGFARLVEGNWLCLVMIAVACLLFYLAIVKKFSLCYCCLSLSVVADQSAGSRIVSSGTIRRRTHSLAGFCKCQ